MPSTRKKFNKAGQAFYEIRVSRGRDKSYLTRRWYVPEGWSQKAIDRELASVAAEFERQSAAQRNARKPRRRPQKPLAFLPSNNTGKECSCLLRALQ